MESIAAQALVLLSRMEECPSCGELSYASHASRGVQGCNSCEEKVCSKCFYGCRYTCPVAKPPPPTLERQINILRWECAEEYLRNNPDKNEVIVQHIPYEHLYKVIRDESGFLVRLHYDRVCSSCGTFSIHESGAEKFFVCQECLDEFLRKE